MYAYVLEIDEEPEGAVMFLLIAVRSVCVRAASSLQLSLALGSKRASLQVFVRSPLSVCLMLKMSDFSDFDYLFIPLLLCDTANISHKTASEILVSSIVDPLKIFHLKA